MKAEIIAIGSELLTPDHIDSNSLYLTQKLNESGFEVHLKSVVGDNVEDIERLLRESLSRSKITLLCGGLGPTEDDVTRAATARALNRRLILNQEILDALHRRFELRGYRMARINERQAEIIEGAEILENRVGTAPGMWIEDQGACLALLPGPPRELQPMFESQVAHHIRELGAGRRLEKRILGVQGIPESEVDSRVAPIYKAYPAIQTTILAAKGCITLRLQTWLGPGEESSDLDTLADRVCAELGDAVFTRTGEKLEAVVGRMLRQSGSTIAVAESCTAGMIGSTITRIEGSSEYFLGGVTCYSNKLKTRLCLVPSELIERHGAVSAEVAEAMARGVREVIGSNIGLAVTGIAGPGGGSEQKPVGLVYFGLADASRCIHVRRVLPGDREMVRELATTSSLGCLRRFLLK